VGIVIAGSDSGGTRPSRSRCRTAGRGCPPRSPRERNFLCPLAVLLGLPRQPTPPASGWSSICRPPPGM